jgi:molybdopterin synthase catalytic subunit
VAFLTGAPIQIQGLIDVVAGPARGAVATFLGVVRDHHRGRGVQALVYSAYHPMAEAVAAEIVSEAEARWPVRVALQHRLGGLSVGDIAVAVAVAGDHRDEAFAACRHVIEALKSRVPIWKQETYADGSVDWVDPTADGVESRKAGARGPA